MLYSLRASILGAVIFLVLVSTAMPQEAPVPVWKSKTTVPRAIRRDVPMTNAIRRAHKSGTRDFTGRPGKNYWQLKTDYTIRVKLDRAAKTLIGSESIVLHNTSPDSLSSIFLRLDHNLFRGGLPRGVSNPAEITEGMVVTRITVDEREVALASQGNRRRRGQKLRARNLNRTLARITLDEDIKAGSKATITIDWRTKLPGGENGSGHRMTQRWGDRLFQPTQWFPRIAKYDDLRGWDQNEYLGPAEFYNNFGRFDVKIDVPAGWLVSSTGILQNAEEVLTARTIARLKTVLLSDDEVTIVGNGEDERRNATASGDRLVWHYIADNVNDFVWATAENYVWKATRATIPGSGPIPIHLLYLPERAGRFREAGAIARHALEFYSQLWAPYPFPQLTMQDGPSAGMEYPMVINSNAGAADHEVAHQWWPMMLGTNETWYGWMDEGLNIYMNRLSRADSRGRKANFNRVGQQYGGMSGNELEPSMMWISNHAGSYYSFQTYTKTAMMLSMLGGMVGDDKVQEAIRAYTAAWKFKHPSPWDFIFFLNTHLKQDLNWFWYYWLWTTESVDSSIERVTTTDGKTTVVVRQDGQMPSPIVLRVRFAAAGDLIKLKGNAKTVDSHTVDFTWPASVWFHGSRRFSAVVDVGDRIIQSITLDPKRRFPDRNPKDNNWPND